MEGSKKRDRVAKACTYCRKKKIKCDGQTPCSNCKDSDCNYPENHERRPRARKSKINKSENIQTLTERLGKLEDILTSLASNMGTGPTTKNSEILSRFRTELTLTGHGEDSEDSETDESSPEMKHPVIKSSGSQKSVLDMEDGVQKTFHLSDNYFGSHSTLHFFSEKSLKWIFGKLPRQYADLLTPLENLPMVLALCMKSFNDVWFSPKPNDPESREKLNQGSFPEDQDLIFDLLDCFDGIFLASSICLSGDLKSLFNTYYENQAVSPSNRVSFKKSELLIMNISLSLCISSVIDKRMSSTNSGGVSSSGRTPTLFAYSTNDLILLQTRFFASAIYYYDMISVMSEGLKTIQAILLLIIFLETSWIKSHVNYILAAIALRYAQEIGLHRSESFRGLTSSEANLRRRIWWFCEYIDMEVCYRNGKPPLVNPLDVSTLSGRDLNYSMRKLFVKAPNGDIHSLDPTFLQTLLENKGFEGYIGHFMSILTKLRSKSYHSLFSASSCNYSFSDLIKTLEGLNDEMFKISDAMTPSLKPRFYNDPLFDDGLIFTNNFSDSNTSMEFSLSYHLSFFTHFMTINRLVSQIDNMYINVQKDEVTKFRNLALDSARTILHIVRKIDRNVVPFSCINWLIYYPVGAFFILMASCLNRCDKEDTLQDVNLLIDVTLNFFAFNKNVLGNSGGQAYSKLYNQRESTSFLMCGLMLNIGLRIVESRSNYRFIDDNIPLKQHLKDCEIVFPEIYKRHKFPSAGEETINGHSIPSFTFNADDSARNSLFKIPPYMVPGPTGYMNAPFESPGFGSDSKLSTESDAANKPNTPLEAKPGFESEAEFNENLDKFFGGMGMATPNFFFDNNIGL